MTKRYDAVLFDFDGTIADTGEGIFSSIRSAVAAMGFEPVDENLLRTFIGPPILDSFKNGVGMTDEQGRAAVAEYRKAYCESGIYKFELYEGIEALLHEINKNGIKIAIASSKPARFIEKIVDYLNYGSIIDLISCPKSDEIHESKASLINNALKEFGISKERTLMVGDRRFDIEGAVIAGVDSVGVTFGYGSEDELKKAGATFIAGSADEIGHIIFGSFQQSF
ncbi:MAG: HAD hydrolase-like protein [Clostridia bacterium]|nr:HAD hydrolase-like protein [Clostridia bacterium]